jgi:hypothetical protein
MSVTDFIDQLLARGIEVYLPKDRLRIWPPRAYTHGLTDAERDYLRAHAPELKELIRTHGHRETAVHWNDPTRSPSPNLRDSSPSPKSAPLHCPYCGPRQCVGQDSPWFRILHHNDPAEVARRDAEATAEMMKMVGRPHVEL